jgi:hypothetical protein
MPAKLCRSLNGSSTLTVGENLGFAAMGGVINLTIEKSEINFEINRLAADLAHLKISAKLLSLAKIVTEQDSGRKPLRAVSTDKPCRAGTGSDFQPSVCGPTVHLR